jgi:hypothetical protein
MVRWQLRERRLYISHHKRSCKIIDDIRTLYIRFVLSFFLHGDAMVKIAILELKGFVTRIFKDMINDTYEVRRNLFDCLHMPVLTCTFAQVVDEVLTTVDECVVQDQNLSNKNKLKLLQLWVLQQASRRNYKSLPSVTSGQ